MRGHWESTTRKLNKHYQSSRKGQGGIIPPVDPFRLTFGDFYTGGLKFMPMYSIPEAGDIPVYPSGYNETYSFMYGSAHNVTGNNGRSGNFASAAHWEGLRNLEHNIFVAPISTQNYENYNDPSDPDKYAIYQEAQRLYSEGKAAKHLDLNGSGNIWKDYRERYVKYTFPERYYSPAYSKDVEPILGGLSSYPIDEQQFPYDTKFELSARSCKAAAYPSVNTTIHIPQDVTLSQYNSNNTQIVNRTYNIGYSDVVSIYDKELAGESYIEVNITAPDTTFYLNNERTQGYRTDCQKARIYCFIHDNSYYVEQIAHIYDSNGDEITDIVVNLDILTYPNPMCPYFLNSTFVQPHGTNTTYPYPIYNSASLNDGTFNRVSLNYKNMGPLVEHYFVTDEQGYIQTNHSFALYVLGNYPISMMAHFLTETEFWNKHNEWCNDHGGTPYVPPVVTP